MKRVFCRQEIQSYFEHHLGKLKPSQSGQAMARCVFHDDHIASLSVNLETGEWFCFACNSGGAITQFQMRISKCDPATARRELRLWLKGKTSGAEATRRKIVEAYDYTDETGVLLKQVVRFSPKSFAQRKPDGEGWIWNVAGVRDVPYRLSEVMRAQTVFIDVAKSASHHQSHTEIASDNPCYRDLFVIVASFRANDRVQEISGQELMSGVTDPCLRRPCNSSSGVIQFKFCSAVRDAQQSS
jgi:hypothetical protein